MESDIGEAGHFNRSYNAVDGQNKQNKKHLRMSPIRHHESLTQKKRRIPPSFFHGF